MIGPFRGINQEATLPLQRGFQLLWRPQLAIGHQIELDQGVVQNRRELMEVFVGFRPCHLELCPQDIKGWIDLIIIEEEQELVCYRREFAFAAPSRFTPACSGLDPFFIGFLLAYLVHVTEGEQQIVELSLGQTGQGLHLAIVSDVLTGGRGTGKSTIIESLRYVLALEPLGEEARKAHEGVLKHVLRSGTKVS